MGSSVTKAGFAILLFVLIAGMGCTAPNHLDAETVAGKRLALMAAVAPMPYVHHLMLASAHIAPHDPLGRPPVGPAADEQQRVEHLEHLLKTAAEDVDVPLRVAERLAHTIAGQTGAVLSNDPNTADYILDVRVRSHGLMMRSISLPAWFFVEAEASLTERATGKVLWQREIERDRIAADNELTGAEMANATEALIATELERFTETVAEQFAYHLRQAAN